MTSVKDDSAPLVIQAQHAPLPWTLHEKFRFELLDARGKSIVDCCSSYIGRVTDEANAALIVKAVNAYASLQTPSPEVVGAVQRAIMEHPFFDQGSATAFGFANTALKAFARAALSALNTSGEADPK